MKRLLLIIVLTLSFQNLAKADDIRDFEIEGMSIGDSLLDFMSKYEIKNNELQYFTTKRDYYIIGIFDDLKNYDQVEIYLRSNDKKYKIKTIAGMLKINSLDKCLSDKINIVKQVDNLFLDTNKQSDIKAHEADVSGVSKQYINQYNFNKMNHIRVECMQWSKKMKKERNFSNTLNVVVMADEVHNWIMGGYK
jgi:hypothetical protein|tara:strand:- start:111 stop:689 length:579 start_codon:yes stop_codon:yes gene_type:complete